MEENEVMVSIRCTVYNQEPYLRKCLNGFVMQKTNFRFEAIVHDDASTDESAVIICEYAEKFPDIIKPIYETVNQYSKHDGSLRRIMDCYTRGKYVALCEGDDYWTDEYKLQRQYDFMEAHPEHSLCFHAHVNEYNDGKLQEVHRYSADVEECPMEDMIMGGGGFMATNSMFYKRECIDDRPDWARRSPVGDAPLMLVLAERGRVGYINKIMSTYRIHSIGSWTERILFDPQKNKEKHKQVQTTWDGFDEWTNYKYHKSVVLKKVRNSIAYHIKRIRWIVNS